MKKVLTVRSVLINSFIVIIFAACGANTYKKSEICSHEDSKIFIQGDKSIIKKQIEESSHPMILPNNYNLPEQSHPMVISTCSKPEE
jgi:hypothetical protein